MFLEKTTTLNPVCGKIICLEKLPTDALIVSTGLTDQQLHLYRQQKPKEMLDYIKSMPLATDINALNSLGATMVIQNKYTKFTFPFFVQSIDLMFS